MYWTEFIWIEHSLNGTCLVLNLTDWIILDWTELNYIKCFWYWIELNIVWTNIIELT